MTTDGLADILRPPASEELDKLMQSVKPTDLTTTELLADDDRHFEADA